MENTGCVSCQKAKTTLVCGACEQPLCKSCAQFLDEDRFSFLSQIPADLKHTTYCPVCFDEKVAPQIAAYDDLMEKAKDIIVYGKHQGKETRLIKRTEKPLKVSDCADREETLMRLAFFAVQAGFNAIIDVDIVAEKVRLGAYQTQKWHGTAMPAQVSSNKIIKDRSFWHNPN